jgi:mono/diheme cytochrome c family protein
MGIVVGVLLCAKISIIRWFQHFGTSLPTLGLMILMCTLILGTLSIPYALKAHDFGDVMTPENMERVRKVLKNVPFAETVDRVELLDDESMAHGRAVLVEKCVACHDIRKVLKKPKTGNGWLKTVVRMQKLPAMGSISILDEDVAPVTAYLVAINPSIQEKRKAEKKIRKEEREAAKEAREGLAHAAEPKGKDAAKAPPFDDAAAQELVEAKCTECHEMDDIENHGGDDRAGWGEIIVQMVDEGGEFSADEVKTILEWLVRHHGPADAKKDGEKPSHD